MKFSISLNHLKNYHQGQINYNPRPRAYEGKGANEGQNERNGPFFIATPQKNQKLPRAYKSLTPSLIIILQDHRKFIIIG
jgi:hypothetical protein